MRILLSFFLCPLIMSASSQADDPIVFVSAFTAGNDGAIHAFRLDSEKGELKPLHRTADIEHPFFLAISPDSQFLYAVDTKQFGGQEDEFVTAFSIEGRTGKLKRINRQSARGSASCYLDIDPTGKTVVVANYSSGNVAAFPVQEDGSLGKIASLVQHHGSSVDPKRQNGPYAHCIVVSPDGRFALAADLGIDKILRYRLNAAKAELVAGETADFARLAPGSGPRHLTFHPSGERVYVINELNNTITSFDFAADTGTLTELQNISTLPDGFSGTSHCADLKITPDGRFLYGTNRGHDSIASYRVDSDDKLKLIRIDSSLGKGPQNLLITPDGHWLLCANMPGNNLVVFAIDASTGQLTATGDPISIPMPSCIRVLP